MSDWNAGTIDEFRATDCVVVVGGTGRVGRLVVDELAAGDGAVRIVGRHRPSSSDGPGGPGDPGPEFVQGSITDRDAIAQAVADATGIVVTVESSGDDDDANGPHRVHAEGFGALVEAAPAEAHIVFITQIYMTRIEEHPDMAPYIAARRIGEATLRARPGPYTIVRPSWLTNGRTSPVRLEQGDRGDGSVSRANVAAAIVAALRQSPDSSGKTFEIYDADQGPNPPPWPDLFGALLPDPQP